MLAHYTKSAKMADFLVGESPNPAQKPTAEHQHHAVFGGSYVIYHFDMTSRSSKTIRNPNPSPTGTRFGFLLFGTGNRGRVYLPRIRPCGRILKRICLRIFFHERCLPYCLYQKEKQPYGLFLFGTGNRGRTCTVTHRILNPARLPIPPYPHITGIVYHIFCGLSRLILRH